MDRLVCVDDFKKEAWAKLDQNAREFVFSAADDEITINANIDAFSRILILPRMLRDVSHRNLSRSVLGKRVEVPIGVSPTGLHRLSHPEGECGTAQGAENVGGIFVLSIYSTSSFEEVARAAPKARKWCQFQMHKDRSLTAALIKNATEAGFEAMVCTVDCHHIGKRRVNARNQLQFPEHLQVPNAAPSGTSAINNEGVPFLELHDIFDPGVTWEAITWLKKISNLPLVLKGIQSAEDAVKAVECGADAVWVSNHGGRQIDTSRTTVDILPEIVAAVNGRAEIYVDGGVRRGSDVFKFLCMGARMVFVGRPAVWGLAVNGAAGTTKVLEILRDELDLTMALSGVRDVNDLSPEYICKKEFAKL